MLFKIYQVTFRSEKSGKTGQFEVMETNDWANVIPLTPEGKIILVKQFRFGSAELSLEFPAGIIENNEEPENAVKRELLEETGGMPTKLKLLGSCKPNPAFLQNTMYHYVAYGVVIHQEQQLDHFEEIEVITLSIEEVEEKILQGEINHSLSLVAWYFYRTPKA